jgi:hypothetical protein
MSAACAVGHEGARRGVMDDAADMKGVAGAASHVIVILIS